jgi:hypothetical protein
MTHEHNAHIAQVVQMLTAQLDAAKVFSSGPAYDEARHVWKRRHSPPGRDRPLRKHRRRSIRRPGRQDVRPVVVGPGWRA